MRIGVISDVHSNLPALEAVLSLFEREGCEEIICCGDIIGIGPFPEETVQRMMSLENAICVLGNHEGYLINGRTWPHPAAMGAEELLYHEWEHARLSASSRIFIGSLPMCALIVRNGVRICAMHYRIGTDGLYAPIMWVPRPDDLDFMFDGINADIILHGHDHRPSLRRLGGRACINPGSLGCPHAGQGIARAGILEVEPTGISYRHIQAGYDIEEVISRMDKLDCPARQIIQRIFFGRWLLCEIAE